MEELKTSLTINLSKIPEIINFESGQMSPKGHFTINTPNTPKKDNKKRKNNHYKLTSFLLELLIIQKNREEKNCEIDKRFGMFLFLFRFVFLEKLYLVI